MSDAFGNLFFCLFFFFAIELQPVHGFSFWFFFFLAAKRNKNVVFVVNK
jgi:hypothetical protein